MGPRRLRDGRFTRLCFQRLSFYSIGTPIRTQVTIAIPYQAVELVTELSREALAAGVFRLFSDINPQLALCGSLNQQAAMPVDAGHAYFSGREASGFPFVVRI